MKYRFDGYNWLVRFDKGELLVEGLTKLVKDEDIKGAWVVGLGAAQWADLQFYSLDSKSFQSKKLDQELEVTNIQGNIARINGHPALHLHGTFSDKEMNAYGGHIKEMQVGGTLEVLLHRWYESEGISRSPDSETGLNLLDL